MKILVLFLLVSIQVSAAQENLKGLLPEVKLGSDNEEKNQEKSFNSEILITKSENKAIETLNKIIKKKANTKEEVNLLFRLAELYMRRAKSGRFFDLDLQSENKLKQYGLNNQKAHEALKQALKIYDQIRLRFSNFKDLDYVLFNSALARLQLKEAEKAKALYSQLIAQYPNSVLVPDALLEFGEILYNQQNFIAALEKFKTLEKYPDTKAYPYGLYKSAWCYYNLKNTDQGIKQLLAVVKQNPADSKDDKKYNLRREALRDLTLFVGETLAPSEVFSFFQKITTEDELGEIILALAGLYESHSRFKEISVFTRQYINHYPQSKQTPKCFTKLIETNETLKQRPVVIENLTNMSVFCKQDKVDPTCFTEFRKVSLDISKKWWEIWLKNKNNIEFSDLTEKAFEILLSTDSKTQPDSKSRYAYAELLFQQAKFEQASHNYEIVSLHQNLDKTLAHDSLYGALFSIEKMLEKQENPSVVEKQKSLGLRYLKEFANGEHAIEIQYKLGYIAYKQSEYDLSLDYMKPLLAKNKYETIKTKAEDLVLDIYNIKKDYVTLQSLAKDILKKTADSARTTNLRKIIEEAHYFQIQKESKNLPPLKQIELLISFNSEHRETKMGQDAYWQAISLAYSKSYDVLGANLSLAYIKQYPDDKRKLDALKEATKSFLDSGDLKSAIVTLKNLAEIDINNNLKHSELICDLLKINNQKDESRKCYKVLFTKSNKSRKADLLSKIINTFDDKNSAEYSGIQNQILSYNIEPYATEILINQARKLLIQKNYTAAFNLSLKINTRPVNEDVRAEARLIQAEILESEFVSQSVKAREDKLALVISMKTEKLDKAFTAYSSAIKMSKSDKVQLQGLQGIERLYTHFIEAISNITLPETLSDADKTSLKNELAKLTEPFALKKKSNNERIKNISKLSIIQTNAIVWSEYSAEKSVEPQIKYPDAKKLNQYYLPDSSASEIKKLIQNKKYAEAEKIALTMTSTAENRLTGLYYLSLIADANQEYDKSLWLLEKAKALSGSNKNSYLIDYQKAKVLYSVEDINSALVFFEKVFDMKDSTPEVRIIFAIKAFSDGDYLKASDEFSRLSAEQIYNYGVDLLHIDSILLKGDAAQALKLVDKYSSYKADRLDMLLEQARIFEHFTVNKNTALQFYQKALSKCNDLDQQNWIKRKITFIKSNKNNQIMSYVGGK